MLLPEVTVYPYEAQCYHFVVWPGPPPKLVPGEIIGSYIKCSSKLKKIIVQESEKEKEKTTNVYWFLASWKITTFVAINGAYRVFALVLDQISFRLYIHQTFIHLHPKF